MHTARPPKPTPFEDDWTLDTERMRLINPKFFDYNSQVIYRPEMFQSILRPDLSTFSESAFYRKLNVVQEVRQWILTHMHKEFQRYKLYSGLHDYQGQKVR